MNGNNQWIREHSGIFVFVTQTIDNGYIVVNQHLSETPGNSYDVWLLKTDGEGLITSIDNKSISRGINIYPNPANDFITIESEYNEKINIIVYDAFGRIVSKKQNVDIDFKMDLRLWKTSHAMRRASEKVGAPKGAIMNS